VQGGWVGQEWEQLRQILGQAGQDDEPDSFRCQPVTRPERRTGNEVNRVAADGECNGEAELAALHAAAAEVTHEERERAVPCRAHGLTDSECSRGTCFPAGGWQSGKARGIEQC
jgi:hypothetical protein